MARARVYIATTEGPALVRRLAAEDGLAEEELSAVCLDGGTERLAITKAYTWFVRDHVRPLSGRAAYRLDLDRRIDGGTSWMLGAWIAHLLLAGNRLATGDEAADLAVFATGEVAFAAGSGRRAEVRAGGGVSAKVARLADRAAREAAAGRRVWFVAPDEEAGEARTALARLPEPVRKRIAFHGVGGTEETRALLDAGGRRRRRRVPLAAAVLAASATAALGGHFAWNGMTEDWDKMWREGRYLELDRALDGFAVPALARLFRDRLRDRAVSLEMWVNARRPDDGGACAGLRFRRGAAVADAERLAPGPVYRPDRPRSLCGFTLRASAEEADGGRIVLVSRPETAEDSPPAPARRTASGDAAGTVVLVHDLPLYRDPSWSWVLIAVWAPAAPASSDDLTELAVGAAPARLRALGLTVLRARLEPGGHAGAQGYSSGDSRSAGSRFMRRAAPRQADPPAARSNPERAGFRRHGVAASHAGSPRAQEDRVPGSRGLSIRPPPIPGRRAQWDVRGTFDGGRSGRARGGGEQTVAAFAPPSTAVDAVLGGSAAPSRIRAGVLHLEGQRRPLRRSGGAPKAFERGGRRRRE